MNNKLAYILTLLLSLWNVLVGLLGVSQINEAKSQGVVGNVGQMHLSYATASMLATLLVVVAILGIIGAIGGLTKKPWAKNLSLVAVSLIALYQIFQANLFLAIVAAVVAVLIFISKNK